MKGFIIQSRAIALRYDTAVTQFVDGRQALCLVIFYWIKVRSNKSLRKAFTAFLLQLMSDPESDILAHYSFRLNDIQNSCVDYFVSSLGGGVSHIGACTLTSRVDFSDVGKTSPKFRSPRAYIHTEHHTRFPLGQAEITSFHLLWSLHTCIQHRQ
jgi:hypothetical protein